MRWFVFLCAPVFFNNAYCQDLVWQEHCTITNLTVGPDSAVHCQLTGPTGDITFDDFGPCKVNIDRVTAHHNGIWTMSIILPSNVFAVHQSFTALVSTAEPKLTVSTHVQQDKPLVELQCSIISSEAITACVFRDPAGQIIQARHGVAEDRYSFMKSSIIGAQTCGIEINGPLKSELGMWRCDLQTATDTYYGYLSVICPWAMQDPEIADAIVSVPTLISQTNNQVVSEGDSVTMFCSIQSAIRYCYFRAQNGSIFNISPATSSFSMEYVGAGLDAGECGVRFAGLLATESGHWSCHVGFPDVTQPEQRVQFVIEVQEAITATQYSDGSELVVKGVVNSGAALEYCRYVRIDGQGFISAYLPNGYTDFSSLHNGHCKVRIESPTILDNHPWTVVAKVIGEEEELAQTTYHMSSTEEMTPQNAPRRVKWWVYVTVLPSVVLTVLLITFAVRRSRRGSGHSVTDDGRNAKTNKDPEQYKTDA